MKVGDLVKYVSGRFSDTVNNPLWNGKHGKIKMKIIRTKKNFSVGLGFVVEFYIDDLRLTQYYCDNDLELIPSNKKIIEELTI